MYYLSWAIAWGMLVYFFDFIKEPEAVGFCIAFCGMSLAFFVKEVTNDRQRR